MTMFFHDNIWNDIINEGSKNYKVKLLIGLSNKQWVAASSAAWGWLCV